MDIDLYYNRNRFKHVTVLHEYGIEPQCYKNNLTDHLLLEYVIWVRMYSDNYDECKITLNDFLHYMNNVLNHKHDCVL